jgi:hypothetical protein
MKSKKAVYFLGVLVLGVWGMILQKIFLTMQNKDGDKVAVNTKVVGKRSVPYQYPDTFKLLLNYPDPFTGQLPKRQDTTVKPKAEIRNEVQTMAPVDPFESVKYVGFVADGSGRRRLAILSYKGEEKLLKEGDMLQGIKVLKVENSAVRISSGRAIKLLRKE